MPGVVPDEGSLAAPCMLIGEAPGEHEDHWKRPFIGPSGQRLEHWWGRVGLARQDFYITNVWRERPFGNRIETVNREQLLGAVTELHQRIAALEDPMLLVPTGNIALRALMRRPLWGKESPKITDWRGSVLSYRDLRGRDLKVIPTLHPAYTFREPGAERACLHDWRRIAKDRHFKDLRLPQRSHWIEPTVHDIEEWIDFALAHPMSWLAFDIETTQRGGNQILCVGFSIDPQASFVIPTTPRYWEGRADMGWVWQQVRRLLLGPHPKVTQNGHYDYYWLGQLEGITPRRWFWDTLAMHHCLDITDQHSLDYLASVHSREPFWKRTVKDAEQRATYINDEHALWTYNGIDCCVTLELAFKFYRLLERRGQLPFFKAHYRDLFRPALDMMRHGIRVDERARRWWHFNLQAERIETQDRLADLAGHPLHAAKSLSPIKLKAFLYGHEEGGLGLPKKIDRKAKSKDRLTTKEVALRQSMLWVAKQPGAKWDRAREAMECILRERRMDKLAGFLQAKVIDPDGRFRATFKQTTETGRFASAKNPMRTGLNLQNQDRQIRRTFVPDKPGQVFLECDYSQAEGRVVYVRSQDPALIALAQAKPWDFDQHTYNAKIIFGDVPITKDMRYLGKKTTHGAQRGLGGERMSGELLKDGHVRSVAECERYIQRYLRAHPGLQNYFRMVRTTLLQERRLVSIWGRVWSVEHERFNEELYRRAYSWYPQTEIADLMNQQGFKPLWRELQRTRLDAHVNAQVHDSLLISCWPADAYDLAQFIQAHMEVPLDYGYTQLSVPVEFKLGTTWEGTVEFKRLPSRQEFTEQAEAVATKFAVAV